MELIKLVYLLIVYFVTLSLAMTKPNIVFIIADDLGWDDVSFHGSNQIVTPNIDLLAYTGVALGRYYTHPICTPTRSALLTGKYSYKIGMQGYPLAMSEDRGIPINEKLLPEYLKDAGYKTHLVGKWHVGSSRNEYLPTSRGFDSHFGHRGGLVDYYEYTLDETFMPTENSGKSTFSGFALYKNLTPAWETYGYVTDVYTQEAASIIKKHDTSFPLFLMVAHNAVHASNEGAPLQAPPDVVREMRHIELTSRRIFAAVVKKLDDSIGDIVKTLSDKGILNNTIIAFVSDNGAMTTGEYQNYGSNYPLRGLKTTPFEGGVRVTGLIWSAALQNEEHYWDGYMHVTDWMPTLLSAAGEKIPPRIDGFDQWRNINNNAASSRNVIYEIDDYTGFSSIIFGKYKLLTGSVVKNYSNHQGAELQGIIGEAPSYTNALLHSNMYGVLHSFGRTFKTSDLKLRHSSNIKCFLFLKNSLCLPDDETVCLYNIIRDPCETTDLSADNPELVAMMRMLLENEKTHMIPRQLPVYRDPLSVPSLFNFTWAPWLPDSRTLGSRH